MSSSMADSRGPAVSATEGAPDPPGRWRALAILATAVLLAMTPWFSTSAVLPQLRADWSLGTTAATWLTIAVQLGFVAGALCSAVFNVADRISPRRLILAGSLIASAANLVLVAVDTIWPALALRFATGAALALVYPPALKSMATWFRRNRGTALGVLIGALTVGSAAPHLVNGFGGPGWKGVIVVTSILTLAGGVLAGVAGRDGPFPFPATTFDWRQIGLVFRNRPVRLASLGYFGHMWELYAMWGWFAAFFADVLADHAVQDPRRGAAFAAFAVIAIGALGSWTGGILSDRYGRTQAASLAMACSGTVAIFMGFTRNLSVPLVLILGLFWGFWVIADSAQFSALVTERADQAYVGTALTMQLAVGFSLTTVTIWLVPAVRDAAGWSWALALLAPGPLLGIIAMQRLQRLPAT